MVGSGIQRLGQFGAMLPYNDDDTCAPHCGREHREGIISSTTQPFIAHPLTTYWETS